VSTFQRSLSLFADAKLANGLSDRFALTGPYLCLTKVADDLICRVTLSRHANPFARVPNPNSGNGNSPGGAGQGDTLGTTLESKPPGSFEPISDMVRGGPFALKPGQ
jgi:hypothetical protein